MKILRIAAVIAAIFITSMIFSGCNRKTTSVSFIASLDFVDSLMRNGQIEDARKTLAEIEKAASTAVHYLSVAKRYFDLADYTGADVFLQKALKAHRTDKEIRAVYARFLLSMGTFDRAAEIAAPLAGTKYGSILTEAKIYAAKDRTVFLDKTFIQHYLDAFAATHDSLFLRNAALVYAKIGDYAKAAALCPQNLLYYEQPLFWAYIQYDSRNFTAALNSLAVIDNSREASLIKSDVFTRSEQFAEAFTVWKLIIDRYADFSPVPYANAALYAKQTEQYNERADFLFGLVTHFPDYVAGLVAYAQLALEFAKPPTDDIFAADLRSRGLLSLSMEAQAKSKKIPVEDAFKRIAQALERTHNPQLAVEYMKLQWIVEKKTAAQRTVDIWLALEKDPANDYLKQYATWFFMLLDDTQAASQVFGAYLRQKGSDNYETLLPLLNGWESEYAAYLLTNNRENPAHKSYQTSLQLYERALAENPQSYTLIMNSANVHNSAGKPNVALDLYGTAASLAQTSKQRAETHYRAAQIYAAKGDVRNATISLQYALNTDPENTKARLLLRKISQ